MRGNAAGEPSCREDGNAVAIYRSLAPNLHPAFVTVNRSVTWSQWLESVDQLEGTYSSLRRSRVGLLMRASEKSYALLMSLSLLECDVFLLDEWAAPEDLKQTAQANHFALTIDPLADSAEFRAIPDDVDVGDGDFTGPTLTILTSGSSGRPKPVRHRWDSLTRTVRKRRSPGSQCWLLTYRPHLYAGIQVFLHCLLNQETLVIPEPAMTVDALLSMMRTTQVRAVSGTPSYWRRLVTLGNRDALKAVPLEQITLGGEIADQTILDTLKQMYPKARVVHIYATSELGRCFSVTDGTAGFPAKFLDRVSDSGVELKLVAGELFVRTVNAMLDSDRHGGTGSAPLDWRATGDQVEQIEDRCYFVGRRSDHINVGGNKVQPLRVEQVIQPVPGVRDVRVFGRRSSLVGELVACEFVAEPGFEPEQVKQALHEACRERLDAHERPRLVQSVQSIALSSAGKKSRQQ
jgi:acyl-CoA synthetase (AMP-forming)/AMP-acid ligase II